MSDSFITCPFCSGHEALHHETIGVLKEAIEHALTEDYLLPVVRGELENIRNVILNTAEREEIDPLLE